MLLVHVHDVHVVTCRVGLLQAIILPDLVLQFANDLDHLNQLVVSNQVHR